MVFVIIRLNIRALVTPDITPTTGFNKQVNLFAGFYGKLFDSPNLVTLLQVSWIFHWDMKEILLAYLFS